MMGDNLTKTKKVACPHCKTEITVHGISGETIEITCPECNAKGIFAFPEEKPVSKSTTGPVAIEVNNIEFTYPKSNKKAVNGVSFGIKKGEIFGFLGPNGAGKTGVGFELPNHYQKLTALENLELFASFYRRKTIAPMKLLEMVELEKDANQRVATFSKGMKSKLNFARSLINDPEVLFLDEPTTGLDPISSRLIKNIILQKRKEGKAIFLTTHNMTDADELCDRVGFIVDGKLTLIESPRELKIRHGKKIVKLEYLKDGELERQDFELQNLADNKNFLSLLKTGNVQTIHTAEATLDDIFIKATGRQLK
jgi:fluoroquinolone transport system ATP-binding protein